MSNTIVYSEYTPVMEIEIEITFAKIGFHLDRLDRRSAKLGVDLDL